MSKGLFSHTSRSVGFHSLGDFKTKTSLIFLISGEAKDCTLPFFPYTKKGFAPIWVYKYENLMNKGLAFGQKLGINRK